MNGPPQSTAPFAVDDTNLEYPSFSADPEVCGQQVFEVAWPEGMEVEYPVDRNLDDLGLLRVLFIICQLHDQ
jgi:hypothetical protein